MRPLYFTAALSWLGLWFHDAREFPGTAGITVDSVGMGLIAALLVLAACARREPAGRCWQCWCTER